MTGNVTPFGTLSDGREVHEIAIGSDQLQVRLLTLGALLRDIRLKGVTHSLVLGSDRLADYEGDLRFFGAIVGPVANRIGGARAVVDGRECRFDADAAGGHSLHGGPAGTWAHVWEVAEAGPDAVTFTLSLPDGLGGYPGNRVLTARYAVAGATLRLELSATTDAPTLMNLASHAFWTMQDRPSWAGHRLRIAAERYLPTDDTVLPTGEVAEVAGTPFDFRAGRVASPGEPPLDHSFCLSDEAVPMRDVLWLTGQDGVCMTLATTAPGLQVFDQRSPALPGRAPFEGLAIEPQLWPDAPNRPHFPSVALAPGETWSQTSEFRFDRG